MNEVQLYKSLPLKQIKVKDVSIGLRQIGQGDDLIFIHGFPTHGYTWRKLIPQLSKKFKCHILDLPGLGNSDWTNETDFNSKTQAEHILELLNIEGINKISLIAHNSGATVARAIAIKKPSLVENLILLNTEIPFHRPPWIPFYQKIGLLPMAPFIVRILFRQNWFVKSSMGLKELYSDKEMLNKKVNIGPYLDPVIKSQKKTIGAFRYLKGIDWDFVDACKNLHGEIKANVLFLWGKDDKTFPIDLGKEMTKQFNGKLKFVSIKNASLLPHEEKPIEVLKEILDFINPLPNID